MGRRRRGKGLSFKRSQYCVTFRASAASKQETREHVLFSSAVCRVPIHFSLYRLGKWILAAGNQYSFISLFLSFILNTGESCMVTLLYCRTKANFVDCWGSDWEKQEISSALNNCSAEVQRQGLRKENNGALYLDTWSISGNPRLLFLY